MKILMVSDDFLPNPGGIAAHVYELSKAIASEGHHVDLIAGHSHLLADRPIGNLPRNFSILSNTPFKRYPPGYILNSWRMIHKLRAAFKKTDYDVIHWHNLVWETSAIKLGAPKTPALIFTNHSSGYLRRVRVPWRRRFQLPWLLNTADRIISPSTELVETSIQAGYPPERLSYIPNGVDTKVFMPGKPDANLMEKYGLNSSHRVLVVPRRLDPKNGVDVLVKALPFIGALLGTLRVLLVGDGQQRPELESLVKTLNVSENVIFCGSQSRDAMPSHLHLGELGLLPSRAEAVSLAGLEAMACGLPIIGSAVGGIPEFVSNGENGFLFQSENSQELADKIKLWLELPDLRRKEMSRQAVHSVESRFSWQVCAERTLQVYTTALSEKRSS